MYGPFWTLTVRTFSSIILANRNIFIKDRDILLVRHHLPRILNRILPLLKTLQLRLHPPQRSSGSHLHLRDRRPSCIMGDSSMARCERMGSHRMDRGVGVRDDRMDPRQLALHRSYRFVPMDTCGTCGRGFGVLLGKECVSHLSCGE